MCVLEDGSLTGKGGPSGGFRGQKMLELTHEGR